MSSDGPSTRYDLVVFFGDNEGSMMLRQEGETWRIEFEGIITVTDRDGATSTECIRQTWSFSSDSAFLLTLNFGTERTPRVSLAGNDKTSIGVIGETVASTIRATSSQPASHPGPEAT